MAKKHSKATARKRIRPAIPWRVYTLAGTLLLFMVGCVVASQLLWASATPETEVSPPASITSPTAKGEAVSNAPAGDNTARTLNLYGGGMRPLVEERDGVQTLNIYGPGGRIIAQVVRDRQGAETVRYLLTDHLGSTRVVLDAEDKTVARYEYAPHGETTVAGTAAGEVRYRYTGHPYDEGQEVYETLARVYDPTVGRFLSVDPQRDDASPYVYAGNNPVGYLDPTGGGGVPFFMETNAHLDLDKLPSKSIVDLFGMPSSGRMIGSTQFASSDGSWKGTLFADNMHGLIFGAGKTKVDRTREFFWFIGGKEEVDLPRGLISSIEKGNEYVRGFGDRIVILDFTGTGTGVDNQKRLKDLHRRSVVISAEVTGTGRGKNNRRIATEFKVKTGLEGTHKMMYRNQFQQHVDNQIKAEWPDFIPNEAAPLGPRGEALKSTRATKTAGEKRPGPSPEDGATSHSKVPKIDDDTPSNELFKTDVLGDLSSPFHELPP